MKKQPKPRKHLLYVTGIATDNGFHVVGITPAVTGKTTLLASNIRSTRVRGDSHSATRISFVVREYMVSK